MQGAAILVWLDMSAAFDTIDHKILLKRLEQECGITGHALTWFEPYLSGRQQAVIINGARSKEYPLDFGVPQASVLGPILFGLYAHPLEDIARKHNLQFHIYADDTQLYLAFKPSNKKHPNTTEEAIKRVEACIEEIKEWVAKNFLKLNDDKTELILMKKDKKQTQG